jgi:hypothetical protein
MDQHGLVKGVQKLKVGNEPEPQGSAPNKYEYAPLAETEAIRVVELEPGLSISEPISCRIVHTTLEEASMAPMDDTQKHKISNAQTAFSNVGNGYTALSYTVRFLKKHLIYTSFFQGAF